MVTVIHPLSLMGALFVVTVIGSVDELMINCLTPIFNDPRAWFASHPCVVVNEMASLGSGKVSVFMLPVGSVVIWTVIFSGKWMWVACTDFFES